MDDVLDFLSWVAAKQLLNTDQLPTPNTQYPIPISIGRELDCGSFLYINARTCQSVEFMRA
jgi:hypothetical protein